MSKAPQKRLVEFDAVGFTKALRNELQKATTQLKNKMLEKARANLATIPFKPNKVNLANSIPTSDATRKMAVLNSIIGERLDWLGHSVYLSSYKTKTVVSGSVTALRGNFQDTHIGIYYEYGTGENADLNGPMHLARGHWNPYRAFGSRQPIVSRSRKLNGGVWTDIGGNVRKTTALVGGRRSDNFLNFVGQDLLAYHWFRRAFYDLKDEVTETYKAALARVDPFRFIRMPRQIVLGRRWQ